MEISNLTGVDIDVVLDGFEEAFREYAVGFDRKELEAMFVRRGYDPEVSFGAFDDGKLVAFTLTGRGIYGGRLTAYDCATGTHPAYRGRHLARNLFDQAVVRLRELGFEQYVLEVLKDNGPAIELYRNAGFCKTADFDCFRMPVSGLRVVDKTPDLEFEVRGILPDEVYASEEFCDFLPSWQNSLESLVRGSGGLDFWGAYVGRRMVGCCVYDPMTGDVARLAMTPRLRRHGIATELLRAALSRTVSPTAKVLNIDATNKTLPLFLTAVGFGAGLSQFEMTKKL